MGNRGVGRPPITDVIPAEKIIKAYELEGSARGAARRLGTTHTTVIKVLRDNGQEIRPPSMWTFNDKKKAHKKHSQFVKWLQQNKGVVLPRSIKALAEMSGCSYHAINCFLYRRRKPLKEKMRDLPDLRNLGVLMVSVNDKLINTRDFIEYEYDIDHYSLDVQIVASTSEYERIAFDIPNPEAFRVRVWQINTNQLVNGYSPERL